MSYDPYHFHTVLRQREMTRAERIEADAPAGPAHGHPAAGGGVSREEAEGRALPDPACGPCPPVHEQLNGFGPEAEGYRL